MAFLKLDTSKMQVHLHVVILTVHSNQKISYKYNMHVIFTMWPESLYELWQKMSMIPSDILPKIPNASGLQLPLYTIDYHI
jgi:tyrosyl-tRNA synthetase